MQQETLEKKDVGRKDLWKGFEDDLIKPFLDVFPQEERLKVAELTGRTLHAVNVRWSKMRSLELQKKAKEAAEGREAAQVNGLKSAIVNPLKEQSLSLNGATIPVLEVNQAQKDLMDTICTVIHNVNGKYFILKVV